MSASKWRVIVIGIGAMQTSDGQIIEYDDAEIAEYYARLFYGSSPTAVECDEYGHRTTAIHFSW